MDNKNSMNNKVDSYKNTIQQNTENSKGSVDDCHKCNTNDCHKKEQHNNSTDTV